MRGQKLKRDVLINIVFAGARLLVLLWVIRLAGIILTPVLLGLFLLARRWSDVGANLLQAGSSQTLLRYIPIHSQNWNVKSGYVLFALLFFLCLAIISLPLFWVLRGPLSQIFFAGYSNTELLAFWTGVLILSMVINFIAIAIFLGERRMFAANIVALMSGSGFLLLAILGTLVSGWNRQLTPLGLTQFQALTMAGLSLLVLIPYVLDLLSKSSVGETAWVGVRKDFAQYGLPRSIMAFLDAGLFLIGPWLLRYDVAQAGYLIISLTVVRAAQAAIMPINQVALVVTAGLIGRGERELIREGTLLVFGISVYAAVLGMSILIPWTERLTTLWLGQPTTIQGVLPYLSVLLWGLLPFAIFQGLKGTVEARWVQPRNVYTLLIASSLQIGLYVLLAPYIGSETAISFALLVALWAMGILTVLWVLPDLQLRSTYWGWDRLLIVATILGVFNWMCASMSIGYLVFPAFLGTIVILSAFFFLVPTEFMRSLMEFLRTSQANAV